MTHLRVIRFTLTIQKDIFEVGSFSTEVSVWDDRSTAGPSVCFVILWLMMMVMLVLLLMAVMMLMMMLLLWIRANMMVELFKLPF